MDAFEYYRESICVALDECGALSKLTDEEIDEIAQAVVGSAENFSTAFGYEHIPDPRDTEIERLRARHTEEIQRHVRECDRAFLAACRAARVRPDEVFLNEYGYLEYRR